MTPPRTLPQYRCHKVVEAARIVSIDQCHGPANDHGAMLTLDGVDGPWHVDRVFLAKHNPQPGGYFVRYADGYDSFSPALAFEEGYTLVQSLDESKV